MTILLATEESSSTHAARRSFSCFLSELDYLWHSVYTDALFQDSSLQQGKPEVKKVNYLLGC